MISRPQQRVHMIGIGGCAMSGLARLLVARGHAVTGTDACDSSTLADLRAHGVDTNVGHGSDRLPANADLVIHSAAIRADNPELRAASTRNIIVRSYAQAIGELMAGSYGIAVAGTHGKTTTAGILASVFLACGKDPEVLIGGVHPTLGGNFRAGGDPYFIAEACEFNRSFLHLRPRAAIVTNLELDHPDVYCDESALTEAFHEFLAGVEQPGLVIVGGDGASRDLDCGAARRVTFGFEPDNDWRAVEVELGPRPSFSVRYGGGILGRVELQVPGVHSISNALAAYALAAELGLDGAGIRSGLAHFPGMDRRFQLRGTCAGVDLVDDYAHHPTEVACAIAAARDSFPEQRVWAVFQPHQFGRLSAFGDSFASALAGADRVVLAPVYSVREKETDFPSGMLERLSASIGQAGTPSRLASSLSETEDVLAESLESGDVCLLLGAGDVGSVVAPLSGRLSARGPR